jgi:hypothetical protein
MSPRIIEGEDTHKAMFGWARSSRQASLQATGSSRLDDSGVRVVVTSEGEAAATMA